MIKYVPTHSSVVLEEIPSKVSLAVEISNCRGNCVGCHSPYLREDVGVELTEDVIDALIGDNFGVDCFLFLGEGQDPSTLARLATHVRSKHCMPVALYSGRKQIEEDLYHVLDFVKLGPYIPERGPLNSPTTNQRLYRISIVEGVPVKEDITPVFWRKKKART